MITHDLDSLYTICDRVAVLVDKRIAIADSLPKVQAYEHPWVQEYFGISNMTNMKSPSKAAFKACRKVLRCGLMALKWVM